MTSCRRAGGVVRVHMTNTVEGCMKKNDMGGGGGGVKMPQNSMTSFLDDPIDSNSLVFVCPLVDFTITLVAGSVYTVDVSDSNNLGEHQTSSRIVHLMTKCCLITVAFVSQIGHVIISCNKKRNM